ncbi:hypothetical protein DOT_2030 [Desulfosporosinus sp. OT]|nr:hypothetical protein DOT_2030 [Desulfosporosinus sp. OT]
MLALLFWRINFSFLFHAARSRKSFSQREKGKKKTIETVCGVTFSVEQGGEFWMLLKDH